MAWLITVGTCYRECLFGHVSNGVMRLNRTGEIARRCWEEVPHRFPSVTLDAFVVMPNHLHGIILAGDSRPGDGPAGGPAPASVAAIVRWYKSCSTRRINKLHAMPGTPIWGRGHREQAVRRRRELQAVRGQVRGNPALWEEDEYHPAFSRRRPGPW